MKLREKLPGRVPLLRPESPSLMVFYTRIWPSKSPQSPSGSPSRPRSVLDGEKHAPQAPEVDPPCPLLGAQLPPRRPRRRSLAGQQALAQSKTRPLGDLLRQVIRQLVFENRDLMEVRRRGDKSRRVRPFEGQKEGVSTSRRGARGPKFAIVEDPVGELADPEAPEGVLQGISGARRGCSTSVGGLGVQQVGFESTGQPPEGRHAPPEFGVLPPFLPVERVDRRKLAIEDWDPAPGPLP